MSDFMMPEQSGKKLIGGIVLGLLVGYLSPYMLMFAPLFFLAPILTVRLFVHSGIWPVIASTVIQLLISYTLLGIIPTGMLFIALILPMAYTIWALSQKSGFVELLKSVIPVWIIGIALALTLAQLSVGMNLADYVSQAVETQLNFFPVGITDWLLTVSNGKLTEDINALILKAGFFENGFLTDIERSRSITSLINDIRNIISLYMPGFLISSAALTGLVASAWPSRIMVRTGKMPAKSWVAIKKWHLPASMTFGMLGLYAVSFIAVNASGAVSILSVYYAVDTIVQFVFCIQAVGAVERRLSKTAMRPKGRGVLIVFLVFYPGIREITVFFGMLSALVGQTYGAIPQIIKRRKDDGEDS